MKDKLVTIGLILLMLTSLFFAIRGEVLRDNYIKDLEEQINDMNEQIIYMEKEIDKLHVDIMNLE